MVVRHAHRAWRAGCRPRAPKEGRRGDARTTPLPFTTLSGGCKSTLSGERVDSAIAFSKLGVTNRTGTVLARSNAQNEQIAQRSSDERLSELRLEWSDRVGDG